MPAAPDRFADAAARPRDSQVATLEEEFFYPARDDTCRLWFRENGLAGYSWFVPKGNGWLNVGLGAFSKHLRHDAPSLRDHWRLFVGKLADQGLVQGREFNPRGHTYFVRPPEQDVRRDACFLVGDSAALATRDLGEGIGPAVESGLLAAHAIVTGQPYDLGGMTKCSYLPPGWVTNTAERVVDRRGGFFRRPRLRAWCLGGVTVWHGDLGLLTIRSAAPCASATGSATPLRP